MSLARLTSALCLSALLVACGDDPKTESTVDPVLDADPAADEVIVINAPRYLTPDGGDTLRAEAFTGPVEVLLPTASGYTRLASTAVSTGRASVRNVPADASYLVRTGNAYLYTSSRVVQRGLVLAQRPDVAVPSSSPSSDVATLTVSGLAPWDEQHLDGGESDSLQLVTPAVGNVVDVTPDELPSQGTTSLTGASARLFAVTGPLPTLNGTESVTLTQRSVRDGGMLGDQPVRYSAARRAATFKAPAFDGSGPLQLNAAMQDLPQSTFSFDLRGAEFAAQLPKIHPSATSSGLMFYVSPAAYGLEKYGWVGYSGELLTYWQNPRQEANLAATFSYGNPFPASWGRVANVDFIGRYTVTLPSGTRVSFSRTLNVGDTLENLAAAPITPTQLPPESLRVDGAAAQDARPLASLTPTVSWEAPAVGVPTAYALAVIRFNETAGTAPRTTVATVRMPASVRSLRLPEGILESGRHYVFAVSALRTPNWDLAREHTTWKLPVAAGDTISGLLTAP